MFLKSRLSNNNTSSLQVYKTRAMESFTFYFEHEIDSVKIRLNSILHLSLSLSLSLPFFTHILQPLFSFQSPGLKRWIVTSVVEKKKEKKKRKRKRNQRGPPLKIVLPLCSCRSSTPEILEDLVKAACKDRYVS